jgi:polygalacturonase
MSGAVTISNTGVTALSASVIVPANFANAEPGALHTYDIDGLPIAIGPGLSGTVLKSAGTGYAPVWAPETSLAELNWIITSALHINVLPNTGYVLNKAALTFTVDSTTTDICTTSSAHGFLNGEQIVQVLTTGTRPGGLVAATAYYAGVTSTTKFKFYPTYADAIASTNPINITSIGSGVHSLGLRVELILPASCGAGKSIRIVSQGDPTWYLQQGAAHYCSYANNVTPVGTTGRVYSNDNRTNIEIVCTIANTRFQVTQVVGAITLDTPSVDPGYSGAGAALPMPFPPDPTYALATTTIKGAKSISSTSGGTLGANRTLELVGDDAAPGPLQYYGTNRASVKGFHALNGGALNVIDYGAVGNGTTNDYPAILDAYNALIALGGGTLYFPEGKTFAIKSAGVHGINIYQQSNVRIEFGKGAILLMDNLVSGNAVSHGIYVQGPCSNIEFVGVHVKYKTMNLVRSGWAPFYFLGANVGFGNEADPVGWSRGSYPGGTENPAGIAAGAVKNVIMRNCISENSPSTFLGIVGVDGITVNNFTGIKSWADGIYHLYFRNAMINNVKLYNVGDDAVSVASYESDKTNANIDNDFHGEGSIISSVYINGVWPLADYHPSGSVVVLGVRDLIFSNITAFDRYSGVRVENGTNSFDYPTLSLNFLACKNVSFDNLVLNNMVQTIRIISKECNLSTATKWWQSDILINGLSAKTMSDPIDVSSAGNNALPGGIMYGYRLLNCKFVGAVNAFSSVCQSYNCEFRNISSDSGFNFYGSVPYSSDPDQLKSGVPIFADNNCTITDLKGSSFLFQGLKNCYIDNIESLNAPSMGMTFASCADIRFGTLRVVNTNRTADANGGGVYIDRYCNRIMGDLIDCVHDNVAVANLVSNESIDTTKIRKVRNQTKLTGYYSRVSDRLWSTTRISSFESIEWYNSVNMPAWRRKVYETDRVLLLGDDALDFYPEDTPNIIIYNSAPLTVNRTITLYPDGASVGDRVRVARKSGCSGAFSLIVRTRPDAVSAIGEVLAFGSFMVTAGTPSGSTNRFTQVTVNGVNQLAAPVNCVEDGSHDNLQATAQAIVDAINITNLYVASRYRNVVSIKGKTGTGATPNGYVIAVTKAGNAAFDNVVPMGGGVTAAAGSAAGSFVTLTTGTISGVDRFADYRYTTTGWAYEAGNL